MTNKQFAAEVTRSLLKKAIGLAVLAVCAAYAFNLGRGECARAAEPNIEAKTVAAFHAQTGMQCPNARVLIVSRDKDAGTWQVDLRCDLGDVWQHFDIVYAGDIATITTGETVRK